MARSPGPPRPLGLGARFTHRPFDRGILKAHAEFFVSMAHTDEDIDHTIAEIEHTVAELESPEADRSKP